jgi:hypothetical protein
VSRVDTLLRGEASFCLLLRYLALRGEIPRIEATLLELGRSCATSIEDSPTKSNREKARQAQRRGLFLRRMGHSGGREEQLLELQPRIKHPRLYCVQRHCRDRGDLFV